jgi:hypothetical protein
MSHRHVSVTPPMAAYRDPDRLWPPKIAGMRSQRAACHLAPIRQVRIVRAGRESPDHERERPATGVRALRRSVYLLARRTRRLLVRARSLSPAGAAAGPGRFVRRLSLPVMLARGGGESGHRESFARMTPRHACKRQCADDGASSIRWPLENYRSRRVSRRSATFSRN